MKAFLLAAIKSAGIMRPLSWVASYFFEKVLVIFEKYLRRAFNEFIDSIKNKKLKKIDEKNEQKYTEVISKPDVTSEEIDSATSDFLNGK